MRPRVIRDAHEYIKEIPIVHIYHIVSSDSTITGGLGREKLKVLLSLTPVRLYRNIEGV